MAEIFQANSHIKSKRQRRDLVSVKDTLSLLDDNDLSDLEDSEDDESDPTWSILLGHSES